MASFGRALTGDAVSDPYSLRLYIVYDRLRARDLGKLCTNIARLYGAAVIGVTGQRSLVFRRGSERISVRPDLDVQEAVTGNSVRLRFVEGWTPAITIEEGELNVGIPRATAIPLVVVYLLLWGARTSLEMMNQYDDHQIKQLDLDLKQMERKLKEHELDDVLKKADERLQQRAIKTVVPIIRSPYVTSCEVNGSPIKVGQR